MTHVRRQEVVTAATAGEVREAARSLGQSGDDVRAGVLRTMAGLLRRDADAILDANARDLEAGRQMGLSDALLDRLALDASRLEDVCAAVESIAGLPDPVGEVMEERVLDNGLQLAKMRVPFGVVCVVYEARPNVTADAAAIAIRTGNGAILRGSRQALHTNVAILACVHGALEHAGLDPRAVSGFDPSDREGFLELISTEGSIDLVIPRGGEQLKKFLLENARVPVLAAAGGNCHVYVDSAADAGKARAIVVNAKTQRPGVCNAAETMLVHRDREQDLLPVLLADLEAAGVEVLEGEEALATEFLDLRIAVKVVDSVEDAIAHVNRYGTGHSEAIVTEDAAAANRFVASVDAAAVYVNASTRFTDGGVYGLGAEVGISTNKLHARGPIGLRELMTSKYVVRGDGHVR